MHFFDRRHELVFQRERYGPGELRALIRHARRVEQQHVVGRHDGNDALRTRDGLRRWRAGVRRRRRAAVAPSDSHDRAPSG